MQQPSLQTDYCCPGDGRSISRAVHLGRLARFYLACRRCPHRHDSGLVSPGRLKQFRETERRGEPYSPFAEEGVAGVFRNQLTPALAHEAAAAFGLWLRDCHPGSDPPTAVVAGDGRPLVAELVAAACDGLRWAGCHVVEVGPATAPAVAMAVEHWGCDGGVLAGNPSGNAAAAGLKFWGPAGRPLSSPGSLDAIHRTFDCLPGRPTRKSGSLKRLPLTPGYLATFHGLYHALRPLTFVLECSSPTLVGYVDGLAAATACRRIPAEPGRAHLGRQVVDNGAHLGIRTDDDGERCLVLDEQGRQLGPAQLALLISMEQDSRDSCVVVPSRQREEVYETLCPNTSNLAMDAAGRLWHRPGEGPWSPDALMTFSLLLKQLSRSDVPLSRLVAG